MIHELHRRGQLWIVRLALIAAATAPIALIRVVLP
jgi:hypothetical protein